MDELEAAYRLVLGQRLGHPILKVLERCRICKESPADEYGYHDVVCSGQNRLGERHSAQITRTHLLILISRFEQLGASKTLIVDHTA